MVSAGVSFEGKGRLHFIEEKAKINANYIYGQFVAEAGVRCTCLAGKQFCIPAGWCTGTWGDVNATVAWQTLPGLH